jgi:hypothetical protein
MPYRPTGRPNGRPRKAIPPPDGTKPRLSARQWRALRAETQPILNGVLPIVSYVAESWLVARVAGVSWRTVQRWRHDELYRRGFLWLLQDAIAAMRRSHLSDPYSSLNIFAWVADRWRGPVTSPLDGRRYATSEEYVDHVIASKAFQPRWQLFG